MFVVILSSVVIVDGGIVGAVGFFFFLFSFRCFCVRGSDGVYFVVCDVVAPVAAFVVGVSVIDSVGGW